MVKNKLCCDKRKIQRNFKELDSYISLINARIHESILHELVFIQNGAPPHWCTNVRKWLKKNLPGRWIGRGGPHICNITWPTRSPNMTKMNYFLWGYIKSKVYVNEHEIIIDLKAAIISVFQEVWWNGDFNHGELGQTTENGPLE